MLHCIWCSTQYACMHIRTCVHICIRMYVWYIWYVSYLHLSRTCIIMYMHHMCEVTTFCIYFVIHHAFYLSHDHEVHNDVSLNGW